MKKKNNNLDKLLQAMPLPCIALKPEAADFTIVEVSDAYLNLCGSKREDLLGKPASYFFPAQEKNGLLLFDSLNKVLKTRQTDRSIDFLGYGIPIPGKEQYEEKYWSTENVPVTDEDGELTHILHVVKDVTAEVRAQNKQKRAQKDLLEKQRQQQYFLDNNPDGLYSLDIQGNLTNANKGLVSLTEVPLPELLKMKLLDFCIPEEQPEVKAHFYRAIEGETASFETTFISAKGSHRNLEVYFLPMNLNGNIEGVYGIAKDITTIRESQKIIVEKKNFLRANSSFISNLLDNELEDASLEEAFAVIGKTMSVDRMYYFGAYISHESGEIYLRQQIEWCRENIKSQADNPDLKGLSAVEVTQMLGLTNRNEPYKAFPNKLPKGELREILLQQDIQSVLILPIFLKGALQGFIGFDDCSKERQWQDEEISFLQSLAHNLTNALEKRAAQAEVVEREEALRASEKKFKALVQEGSDMMGILGLDGRYTFVSDTITTILGLKPEDFLNRNILELVHPDDQALVEDTLANLSSLKRINLQPVRIKHQNGEWRWIEVTATCLCHEPAIQGVVTNARDITTLINQALEIELINERYRLAATATQDLLYDWNLVTDKVQRFFKTAAFLGYSVEEAEQRDFWRSHIHPDELEDLKQHLQSTLADPEKTFINSKYRMKRADGTYAHFLDRAYIIRDSKGKALRLVGASSDISDLTAKSEALEIANKRFGMAMKATNEMIWDWDLSSAYVHRNEAFENVYGYSKNDDSQKEGFWLNKVCSEDKDRVRNSLYAALENPNQDKWKEEYAFMKANGEVASVIDRCFILRDKSGKAIRAVGAVLDVTDFQHAIKKVGDQNKVLREIAWQQSHVVRAPLVRLQGLLELLELNDYEEEMEPAELWQHINASTDELDGIIRNIVNKIQQIEGNPIGKALVETA